MIAVMGAGQLGLMLHEAALRMGYRCRFLDPAPDACAGRVAEHIVAPFDDSDALDRLIDGACVLTYENEHIPAEALERASARVSVAPSAQALRVAQDRLHQRELLDRLGIASSPHAAVSSIEDIVEALRVVGTPAIIKARRGGFDGRGQATIRTPEDAPSAWETIGQRPAMLEGVVSFARELSIVSVRGRTGEMRFYPVVESIHERGILVRTRAPAPGLTTEIEREAQRIARAIAEELGHVGVLAVELFETPRGLLVNEFATRVHNTGHWTIEGACTSQFEHHLLAILARPLESCDLVAPSVMCNIIGEIAPSVSRLRDHPVDGVHVHLYGKEPRPGRKIGHVTCTAPTLQEAEGLVRRVVPELAGAHDVFPGDVRAAAE